MSKTELKNKIHELEIRLGEKVGKLTSMVGVIKTMIDEEHFFPDAISREIAVLESLINRDL